jgi:hypothetical protein
MRALLFAGLLVACGGGGANAPKPDPDPDPDPGPQRSELQVRQDAACEQAGPRLTECAIADAKASMPAEELAKLDLEKTRPVHTREFIKECTAGYMSSRQVRVYEVCLREETECEAFLSCLENAKPQN